VSLLVSPPIKFTFPYRQGPVSPLPPRPIDATLTVTKAARILGVHPNTIRAWSDAGRLRYYRINPRGDRRYRLGDLQRFLVAASTGPEPLGPLPHGPAILRRAAPAHLVRPIAGGALGARAGAALRAMPPIPDQIDQERRRAELDMLAELAGLSGRSAGPDPADLEDLLGAATRAIRQVAGHHLVAAWELAGDRLVPRAQSAAETVRLVELPRTYGTLGAAVAAQRVPATVLDVDPSLGVLADGRPELAVSIPGEGRPWGALLVVGEGLGSLGERDEELAVAAARSLATTIRLSRAARDISHQLHRADALRRVAGDIGSRLDLDQILAGLVDHAMVLFDGDRAAVFLVRPSGEAVAEVSRGLSPTFLNAVRRFPPRSLPSAAMAARRPLFSVNYRDDPRGAGVRAAVVQEGFDTVCTAPLFDGDVLVGLLNVYHDRPHHWTEHEVDTMAALATQASVAIRTAQNYSQLATWAAQLQSIQQLGARLNRLTSVREIGEAIANELRQVIDYHNVRVYRQYGEDLVPVAMLGQVGEYVDETPEALRVKVGQGITGWVAQHQEPQMLPDAAKDPRANTVPGTEDDLDESMLLAPMVFEDQVLGVLVLAKLGLNQFTEDDLRLLVIYASFAAQAMANADATALLREKSEALERQLRSQRELVLITESILTTLDPRAVLDQIADLLERLVGFDNISIEVYDRATRKLRPLTARGVNAEDYLQEWEAGEAGLATWAIEHNEAALVVDQYDDPRVQHFASGPIHGGLVVVPLRGRQGVTGVLTVERLGEGNTFTDDEFDLVKLFAAQVSIALQNAEVYRAVEIRARTDDLTGLLNHGTFRERLFGSVARLEPFSLLMLDLDEFKLVNDALGHQAGDRLLAEIARTIVGAGRETDLFFRYGGDEFALILPGADAKAGVRVAERVRKAILKVGESGTAWQSEGIAVSASFGVATFPNDGSTADSILLAADRACFVAKRSGHGRIATAEEGLSKAAEFSLQDPTPVDPPTPASG
jgi:diguanylate cyclase (GGDEF)-like protein/excisionase family DNA binding protein